MNQLSSGPRLIIVCGLPGAGKTTLAKSLEPQLGAIRFCPDEWMDALSIDVYDEPRRAAVEAIQWTLAQHVLRLGGAAIIEWGTWGRSERDTLRLAARALGAVVELHYLSEPMDVLFDRIQPTAYGRRARSVRRAGTLMPVTKPSLNKLIKFSWPALFQRRPEFLSSECSASGVNILDAPGAIKLRLGCRDRPGEVVWEAIDCRDKGFFGDLYS